jgi:Arc/MetJ-type ribon-helix-helix transcriptional regulator
LAQQLMDTELMNVGFRPTQEDLRVIEANRRKGESTSDVIRRALRQLDRKERNERDRPEVHRLSGADLSAEADAWEYDTDGNIRVTGTSLTVPARPADHA